MSANPTSDGPLSMSTRVKRLVSSDHVWIPAATGGACLLLGGAIARFRPQYGRVFDRPWYNVTTITVAFTAYPYMSWKRKLMAEEAGRDESFEAINRVGWDLAQNERELRRGAFTSPAMNVPSSTTIASPQKSSTDGEQHGKILETITAWTHHVWSFPSTRKRVHTLLQPMLEAEGVSPYDIDVCVTHLANTVDIYTWNEVTTGMLITLMGTVAGGFFSRKSLPRLVVLCSIYPYLLQLYPRSMRDRRRVAAAMARFRATGTLPLARKT
ncbi:hypothetical protein BKA93DRAFT_748982 [Sparassis latifolia]